MAFQKGHRGIPKGTRWKVGPDGKRQMIPPPVSSADLSPSTSTSESFSETPSEESQRSKSPSLPPPRKTTTTSRLQPESPPIFGSTYRKVPEDEKERDEAFKAYRFYSRSLTGAWSKLLDLLSDEPADAEERAAANDALCLMCYQLDLTMLDWRISVPLALGAPLISRAPAIQKKWGKKKIEAPSQPKEPMGSGLHSRSPDTGGTVTPFPQAVSRGPEGSA